MRAVRSGGALKIKEIYFRGGCDLEAANGEKGGL